MANKSKAVMYMVLTLFILAGSALFYNYQHNQQLIAEQLERQRHKDEIDDSLLYACRDGSLKSAQDALAKGANVNALQVRALVENPIGSMARKAFDFLDSSSSHRDPPESPATRQSALMFASLAGSPEIVELLIARKADVHARSYEGKTALNLVRGAANMDATKKYQIIQDLVAAGCEE